MNENANSRHTLPLEAKRRIDGVCLEFEAAWKEGKPQRIERFLGEVRGAERAHLLRELLLLDLDYRRREAEVPSLDEYQARFSQDGRAI